MDEMVGKNKVSKALRLYNAVAKRTAKRNTFESRSSDNILTLWGITLRNGMTWMWVKEGDGYAMYFYSKTKKYRTTSVPKFVFVNFYNFIVHGTDLLSNIKEPLSYEDSPVLKKVGEVSIEL